MDARFWLAVAAVSLLSYLIGSVSFAVIVSRLGASEDVRMHGSGNAGMTNILRNYGKRLAVLTTIGDFGKGIVAVAFGRVLFTLISGNPTPIIDGGYIAGFFAVIGHLYPVFFGFKGGKGVLTSLGVIMVLNPLVALIILVIALPIVFTVRIVSLTVLIGYSLFPVLTLLVDMFVRGLTGAMIWWDLIFALFISGIGTWKHRENIARLRAGTEYRFGEKKKQE